MIRAGGGTYAIIEPVPGRADENGPVVGVIVIAVLVKETTGFLVGLRISQGLQRP